MKLNLIFFACLVFCSVTTFLAVRKYEAAVVVIAANLGGSRKMAITHIAYSKDEPMPAESMKHINVMNAVAVAKSGSEWHNGAASSTSSSTTSSSNATSVSTMSEAMGCLRQTKPDLANISYPDDALEHFYEIQKTLHKWTRYKPHKASGYRGPWIGEFVRSCVKIEYCTHQSMIETSWIFETSCPRCSFALSSTQKTGGFLISKKDSNQTIILSRTYSARMSRC